MDPIYQTRGGHAVYQDVNRSYNELYTKRSRPLHACNAGHRMAWHSKGQGVLSYTKFLSQWCLAILDHNTLSLHATPCTDVVLLGVWWCLYSISTRYAMHRCSVRWRYVCLALELMYSLVPLQHLGEQQGALTQLVKVIREDMEDLQCIEEGFHQT